MSGGNLEHLNAVREEAVQWFLDRLESRLSPTQEQRFQSWLNSSANHREIYCSVEKVWMVAGMGKDDPILETTSPQLAKSSVEDRNDQDAEADLVDRGSGRSFFKKALISCAVIVLAVAPATKLIYNFRAAPAEEALQYFKTETGQRATITLPDGTVVKLDSKTEISFQRLPNERQVKLAFGRAYFEVAKDPSKPFVVEAEGQTIRAIGTAFEVKIEADTVGVVLAEGKVRVEETGKPNLGTDMTPGRQLTINPNRKWVLTNVDVEKETGWIDGRLIFLHDPLSQAIVEVNRYSARKLTFKDEPIPDKLIVGSFPAGDIESFIRALELNGIAMRLSTTPDEIIMTGQDSIKSLGPKRSI